MRFAGIGWSIACKSEGGGGVGGGQIGAVHLSDCDVGLCWWPVAAGW